MKYVTTTRAAAQLTADGLIVGLYDDARLGVAASSIDKASRGWLRRQAQSGDVSGKLGHVAVLAAPSGVKPKRVIAVGLGKRGEFGAAEYRRVLDAAHGAIRDKKIRSLGNGLSLEEVSDTPAYMLARHAAEAAGDAQYRFDTMKSTKGPAAHLSKLTQLVASQSDAKPARLGLSHGDAIAAGKSLTRDLGNLPPNVCTPSYLAKTARELAKEHKKLHTKVLSEADAKRLGMHSFLSVTSGSVEPAKLIVMRYAGAQRKAPIVLVGKGITFDAGGISLKPGPGMDEMKFDMCGAATVIATISVVAALDLPINVIAVVPACENLPSGSATRPGDILTSMSGQTIEVLNTDAEGRLILCDALTYSRRFKPDTVIDVATLTGACVIALGHHRTAVMTPHRALADELLEAGDAAEDRGWPLPVTDEYAAALKSNFADMANVGGRDAGATTAACFLAKFTKGLNWAHLDIAGTAWHGGKQKGASGRPVAMLSEFLLRRSNLLPVRLLCPKLISTCSLAAATTPDNVSPAVSRRKRTALSTASTSTWTTPRPRVASTIDCGHSATAALCRTS